MSATACTTTVHRALAVAGIAGLLFAAAQLPAAAAPGDTSTDSTVANVEVTSSITLGGLTPDFTLTGLPGSTVTGNAAVSYTVTTNNVGGYTVGVQAATATLDPVGTSPDTIPIGDLQVKDASGTYTPLSDTSAVVLRNKASRSLEAGDPYSDDYKVTIPFVASDTYATTLNYVATAS